jgi:hypothetical protein
MSDIDRQRVASYLFRDGDWVAGPLARSPMAEADRLYALLIFRADQLADCTEGSAEADQLRAIAEGLEAYEGKRWPDGVEGGRRAGSASVTRLKLAESYVAE